MENRCCWCGKGDNLYGDLKIDTNNFIFKPRYYHLDCEKKFLKEKNMVNNNGKEKRNI